MTREIKPKYQWPSRAIKVLQGLANSCGEAAQLIGCPTDTSALLGIFFPSSNSTVFAYTWGFVVIVGEEKQILRFSDALENQSIPLPIETVQSLMYRDPLRVEEISLVLGTSAWSRVKGPRVLLAFLYGVFFDLISGRLQWKSGTNSEGNPRNSGTQ